MNPDEFANNLWKCGRDPRAMKAKGLSDSYIKDEMDRYRYVRIKQTSSYSDDLLVLLDCFAIPPLQINGGIQFAQGVERMGGYYIVGEQEADPLLMDADTFEIHLADLSDLSFVICKCALNGGRFLDALILVVQFYARHRDHDDEDARQKDALHSASVCAEAAGGMVYLDFYKSVLGCFI